MSFQRSKTRHYVYRPTRRRGRENIIVLTPPPRRTNRVFFFSTSTFFLSDTHRFFFFLHNRDGHIIIIIVLCQRRKRVYVKRTIYSGDIILLICIYYILTLTRVRPTSVIKVLDSYTFTRRVLYAYSRIAHRDRLSLENRKKKITRDFCHTYSHILTQTHICTRVYIRKTRAVFCSITAVCDFNYPVPRPQSDYRADVCHDSCGGLHIVIYYIACARVYKMINDVTLRTCECASSRGADRNASARSLLLYNIMYSPSVFGRRSSPTEVGVHG